MNKDIDNGNGEKDRFKIYPEDYIFMYIELVGVEYRNEYFIVPSTEKDNTS